MLFTPTRQAWLWNIASNGSDCVEVCFIEIKAPDYASFDFQECHVAQFAQVEKVSSSDESDGRI